MAVLGGGRFLTTRTGNLGLVPDTMFGELSGSRRESDSLSDTVYLPRRVKGCSSKVPELTEATKEQKECPEAPGAAR